MGAILMREGKVLEAEQLYRETISKQVISWQWHSVVNCQLVEALLKLLLEQERYEDAFTCIEEVTLPGDAFREEMRGMVFLHRKNRGEAIAALRGALRSHPRNILLLENVTRLLHLPQDDDRVTSPTKVADGQQSDDLMEALQYAERLETLLPSFEHKLLRAGLLGQLGRDEEALRLVDAVEKHGYITLQMLGLKFGLLQKLARNREAAELLAAYKDRYPSNYGLRFNEATAWAKTAEIQRAMAIWDELRYHPEVDGTLYQNLIIVYIQRAALEPSSFSQAFDIAKEALEKFPDRRELVPLLVQAALGSGRGGEAWDILGQKPELYDGPYLQAIAIEESIELLTQQTQALRAREAYYRAGAIPFATYAVHSPRNAVFLWQARLHVWREGNRGAFHLGNFPTISLKRKRLKIPSAGVVIDMTALLTLGSLHVTREILEVFRQTDKKVFLFPNALRWLEEEVARLSFDQLPLID
jgi:tetratricopeptide (TPR) repeat protein